jgi:hypothetical protein
LGNTKKALCRSAGRHVGINEYSAEEKLLLLLKQDGSLTTEALTLTLGL